MSGHPLRVDGDLIVSQSSPQVSFILVRLLQAVGDRHWLIIENKWIFLTREWMANRIEIGWQETLMNQVTYVALRYSFV